MNRREIFSCKPFEYQVMTGDMSDNGCRRTTRTIEYQIVLNDIPHFMSVFMDDDGSYHVDILNAGINIPVNPLEKTLDTAFTFVWRSHYPFYDSLSSLSGADLAIFIIDHSFPIDVVSRWLASRIYLLDYIKENFSSTRDFGYVWGQEAAQQIFRNGIYTATKPGNISYLPQDVAEKAMAIALNIPVPNKKYATGERTNLVYRQSIDGSAHEKITWLRHIDALRKITQTHDASALMTIQFPDIPMD